MLSTLLAIIRSQVRSVTTSDDLALTFQLAARESKPLLVYATAEGIAERAAGVVAAVFGPAVTTARIVDIVESVTFPDPIADAAELLEVEHGTTCEIDGTCIRVTQPVKGDPWRMVLRVIGLAQDAPIVGAIVNGATDSAAGAWQAPTLVAVRRKGATRRVTVYKFEKMLRPHDAAREGGIPSDYEKGNWYGPDVPVEVEELLIEAGILLDEI